MFGFLFQKKREDVRRLLSGRMNRRYFRQFRYGDRLNPRGSFCEVVWIIPYDEGSSEPQFDQLFPLVTKDISSEGLSLIHNQPIHIKRMLVGLESSVEVNFVVCELQHSTPLGYGFYQVGLLPMEVVYLDQATVEGLKRQFEQFEEQAEVVCAG